MFITSFITESRKLKRFERFFMEYIKSSLILGRSFPHEYIVSVKSQISDFSTQNIISLINVLSNNGPNIEPWGIPQ